MYNVDLTSMSNFHPLEVVDRASETQIKVGEKLHLDNVAVKDLK